MKTPLISIVLPTYNGQRYLAQAIESCLAQTYERFELIVVDDASTDGTPGIIEHYEQADARIRQIRHDENRKLPAALNTGFAAANGDFLTWTSDDNVFLPEALETMLAALVGSPEWGGVYSDYAHMDTEGAASRHVSVLDPVYLVRSNVIGPCFLYRREVHIANDGYDESLFLVEDYDFWMRAAARFRMLPIHQVLYRYRLHDTSLSAQHALSITCQHEVALRRNLPLLRSFPPTAVVAGWIKVAVMARRRGDYRGCLSGLAQAFGVSPTSAMFLLLRILVQGPSLLNRLTLD